MSIKSYINKYLVKHIKGKERDSPLFYFFHIPKTAGTTLNSYIRGQYSDKSVVPASTWNELYGVTNNCSRNDLINYLGSKSLITGHFGNSIDRYLQRPAVTVTILRDPLERTLSQLCHIKADPLYNNWVKTRFILSHETIADVVKDDTRIFFFANYQSRYLASDFDYARIVDESGFRGEDLLFDSSKALLGMNDIDSETLYATAKRRLNTMVCVGVQDYIEELMIMMTYIMVSGSPYNGHLVSTVVTVQYS